MRESYKFIIASIVIAVSIILSIYICNIEESVPDIVIEYIDAIVFADGNQVYVGENLIDSSITSKVLISDKSIDSWEITFHKDNVLEFVLVDESGEYIFPRFYFRYILNASGDIESFTIAKQKAFSKYNEEAY